MEIFYSELRIYEVHSLFTAIQKVYMYSTEFLFIWWTWKFCYFLYCIAFQMFFSLRFITELINELRYPFAVFILNQIRLDMFETGLFCPSLLRSQGSVLPQAKLTWLDLENKNSAQEGWKNHKITPELGYGVNVIFEKLPQHFWIIATELTQKNRPEFTLRN